MAPSPQLATALLALLALLATAMLPAMVGATNDLGTDDDEWNDEDEPGESWNREHYARRRMYPVLSVHCYLQFFIT